MKLYLKLNLCIALMLLFASCKDECDCATGIYQQWVITDMVSVEDRFYPKDKGYSPFIEFSEDGNVNLALDINLCSGSYSADKSGRMDIGYLGCTEACCDSEFSMKVAQTLPLVDSFRLENGQLQLIVPNWGMLVLEMPE